MAYIHIALLYKQKQVLPPMLQSTTHPTTIPRFKISLDTSQDCGNDKQQYFFDKPKQYQSLLSPKCLSSLQ